MPESDHPYVSRGGLKLAAALDAFGIAPAGRVCADLGCSTGGFTDVLLRRGAARVYAVDTGYGVLDWRLRNDARVIALERTNAMHVALPERASLIVIDTGWTRQTKVLPAALRNLAADGEVVTLVKPHYEVEPRSLRKTKGVLSGEALPAVMARVRAEIAACGMAVVAEADSPLRGSGGKNARGNREVLVHLRHA